MTTNADILFSAVRRSVSSVVLSLALLAPLPAWAAEEGQPAAPAPGGLEIPPLTKESDQAPQASQQAPQQTPPPRKEAPREDIVIGTGQAFGGYSGTWRDPVKDENVTTIIAPRQPMTQQPPMYIAPQIYPDWDGGWSQGGGQYYPPYWSQAQRPSRPPHWDHGQRPPRPPHWDQSRPPRPPYWDQSRPPRPPHWDNGHRPPYWNPGQRPPRPPYWDQSRPPRPPYWNPGQRPPQWNPGQRPPQGGGIPPSWWRNSGR